MVYGVYYFESRITGGGIFHFALKPKDSFAHGKFLHYVVYLIRNQSSLRCL